MWIRLLIVLSLLVGATACKHNKRANTTVTRRAAFDLTCPKEELKLNVVDTEGARKMATQIAVRGCEQKAVYVYFPDSDTWIIDGIVNAAAIITERLAWLKGRIDLYVVDGAVNLLGWIVDSASKLVRPMQSGYIQNAMFGVVVFIVVVLLAVVVSR